MLRRAFGMDGGKDQADTRQTGEAATPRTSEAPAAATGGNDMADKQREWASAPTGTPAGTGELNALLGKGSEFDGKLAFEGTVRIDGTFTGEITTSDTLIVGESARVSAEIACGTIIVNGEVTGNIRAAAAVELHKPARVRGDVTTPSLVIERGVVFEGHTRMESETGKIVPISAAEAD